MSPAFVRATYDLFLRLVDKANSSVTHERTTAAMKRPIILMLLFTLANVPYFPNPISLIAFGFGLGMLTAVAINKIVRD
jgi:hypothetical protein